MNKQIIQIVKFNENKYFRKILKSKSKSSQKALELYTLKRIAIQDLRGWVMSNSH